MNLLDFPMKTSAAIRFVLGFCVAALAMQGCRKPSTDDYVFGVVAPFSGQEGASVYGKNIKNGVELALQEINSKNGVDGRRLAALYEDDQLQSSVAVAAVQKLISDKRVS